MTKHRNPIPTVDIIIELENQGIILIERKNPPYGWAIPGGYVNHGESLEDAATREAEEETILKVMLLRQFHTYSDPDRDPRQHNISTVFIAKALEGKAQAASDARGVGIFTAGNLPDNLYFDHRQILLDYFNSKY
jgi:ADP-ribose pyrophosphatase YjhB (NUDIX family)